MRGGRDQAPERPGRVYDSRNGSRIAGTASLRTTPFDRLQGSLGNRLLGRLLQRRARRPEAASGVVVQRAPGLPTKQELQEAGLTPGKKAFRKSSWSKLESALDAYKNLDDSDFAGQKEQLQRIEAIIGEWKASYDNRESGKKLKKMDPAKLEKTKQILNAIEQRRITIQEIETPTFHREGRRRDAHRGGALPPLRLEAKEKEQEQEDAKGSRQKAVSPLQQLLLEMGYKADRNYMSWKVGKLPHVSWKAHVGSANPEERLTIAKTVGPLLASRDAAHKFDIKETDEALDKFLTVYPPEKEEQWAELVDVLESAVSGFATVEIFGDMPVGKTGKVHMRHGQNTPLKMEMAKDVEGVSEVGKLGGFARYDGDAVEGKGLPLLVSHGTFFFSKTKEAPEELTPRAIYMAILVDGRIVPDKREEPNPAGVPMPPGVAPYEKKGM